MRRTHRRTTTNTQTHTKADGDLFELVKLSAAGFDTTLGDYDHRTPLHLAASNCHTDVVKYLIAPGRGGVASIAAKDRWGNSPMDDAARESCDAAAKVLKKAVAAAGM